MIGFYLVGRVTEEPEKTETANGLLLCRLKLSVDRTIRNQENGPEIFEVVLFRNLAEDKYEIGQLLAISGRVQANNFEKEGITYYHANLIGNSVDFVS